jgi:adenylyltransferase/sulfurtransferase
MKAALAFGKCERKDFLKRLLPLSSYLQVRRAFSSSICFVGASACCEYVLRGALPGSISIIDKRKVTKEDLPHGCFVTADIGRTRAYAMTRRLKSIYPTDVKNVGEVPDVELTVVGLGHEVDLSRNGKSPKPVIVVSLREGVVRLEISSDSYVETKTCEVKIEDFAVPTLTDIICARMVIGAITGNVFPSLYFRPTDIFGKVDFESFCGKRIAIIGVGGVGSNLAEAIVRCTEDLELLVFDPDVVECHNLARTNYTVSDIGKLKTDVLRRRLKLIRPDVAVDARPLKVDGNNARDALSGVDLAFDCLDRYRVKHIVNRVCIDQRVPLVSGGTTGRYGYVMPIVPGKSPCFAELYPFDHGEPTCASDGVEITNVLFICYLQMILGAKLVTNPSAYPIYMVDFRSVIPVIDQLHLKRNHDCEACSGST